MTWTQLQRSTQRASPLSNSLTTRRPGSDLGSLSRVLIDLTHTWSCWRGICLNSSSQTFKNCHYLTPTTAQKSTLSTPTSVRSVSGKLNSSTNATRLLPVLLRRSAKENRKNEENCFKTNERLKRLKNHTRRISSPNHKDGRDSLLCALQHSYTIHLCRQIIYSYKTYDDLTELRVEVTRKIALLNNLFISLILTIITL